jgi:hypothetical protein
VKYEYNSNALEAPVNNDVLGPRYNFQGAFHLSHRDPGSYLFGGLAGVGRANFGGTTSITRSSAVKPSST